MAVASLDRTAMDWADSLVHQSAVVSLPTANYDRYSTAKAIGSYRKKIPGHIQHDGRGIDNLSTDVLTSVSRPHLTMAHATDTE
jgi:hypothetical protein